ncbi:FkbM family methyltransferase [bacterium]|nr:MAG: FkbM family methyltransferase [bacterium]
MLSKLKTAAKVFLTTKNWANVWVNIFVLKKPVRAVFRSGYELPVDPRTWHVFSSYASFFRHFPEGEINGTIATVIYRSRKLFFDFGNTAPGIITEFFGKTLPYKIFSDVSKIHDSVVVDIGACSGDSPLWFAMNGAKKVYAFEPLTSYFNLCRRNIILNKLENICEAIHAAVGGKTDNDFFSVESSRQILGMGVGINGDCEKDVPVITLGDIVKRFGIKEGAFLKMDCEGYEYDVISNSSTDTLKIFKNIMMEYHYGYEKLESKLKEAGFSVKHTAPEHVYQPNGGEGFKEMRVGYIFASNE